MASSVFYSPEYSEAVKFYRGFITRIRNLFQNGFPFLTVYLCVACPFFSPILEKPTLPYHVIMGRVTKREPTRKLADVSRVKSQQLSAFTETFGTSWHSRAPRRRQGLNRSGIHRGMTSQILSTSKPSSALRPALVRTDIDRENRGCVLVPSSPHPLSRCFPISFNELRRG